MRRNGVPVSFWSNSTSPMPIWLQWALLAGMAWGVARWRARARRVPTPEPYVTASLTFLIVALLLQAIIFMLTDPALPEAFPQALWWIALAQPSGHPRPNPFEQFVGLVSLGLASLGALPCCAAVTCMLAAAALSPAALLLCTIKAARQAVKGAWTVNKRAAKGAWLVAWELGRSGKPHWSRV